MNRSGVRSPIPSLLALLLLGAASLILAAGAGGAKGGDKGRSLPKGDPHLPPKGKIFTGSSDTGQTSDYREFRTDTLAHPAIMQSFESWGYVPKEAMNRWTDTNTRGMLSLSTAKCWKCPDLISPQSIAEGKGDRYIVALNRALAHRRKPTYIRLMPEMNGYWNRYSAYGSDGQVRDKFHTTADFRDAWRRFVLIMRGGNSKAIDAKLKKLHMPRIRERIDKQLPRPKVSFAWVPQSTGSPDVRGNQPSDYFPGWDYVDWVGADVYGKYPNIAGVNDLYKKFKKRPFMIGEWSSWDVDNPKFVKALFDWVEHHHRARMAIYYQGFGEGADNPYELSDYPKSTEVLRHILNENKYVPFAPENEHKGGRGGKK